MALTHEVAFGNADVADHAFRRGVAGTEGEFAGGLLDHVYGQDYAIGRATRFRLDIHGFEKP
ncbi:hypothetical protein AUC71_13930 [Methyloceanibacter marginalis]|uniref:Uncharacterized protein n=1 Tax=Methyloceanibacter marginalis TaxID=1774971 RepID=A0A1E3WA55_9HYPH|nr:hypothetical protein [Methyloceanibacter marginalis]ODS02698.1 hypothetical protein AUC71_13930 [Methyloceanibacter marginalis]